MSEGACFNSSLITHYSSLAVQLSAGGTGSAAAGACVSGTGFGGEVGCAGSAGGAFGTCGGGAPGCSGSAAGVGCAPSAGAGSASASAAWATGTTSITE